MNKNLSVKKSLCCAAVLFGLYTGPVFAQPVNQLMATVAAQPSRDEKALTLQDCYRLALKQSEIVAIQAEVINEAEGRLRQLIGQLLPQASYEISEERQNGSGGTNFTLREIPERKFVFSQRLFSGFREFASLAAGRAEKRQRIQELRRAEQLLFIDVSDAFYFFLGYQEDLATLARIQEVLAQRVEELTKREELGRSRPSEVASAQAQLSRTEAELEQTTASLSVARELLVFLTGQEVEAIRDEELPALPELSENDYAAKAEQRPDVIAAREALKAAQKNIAFERGAYFPTVTAEGNYYKERVGNASSVDWDATLRISVPITGLVATSGRVKEARALATEQDLLQDRTYRNAVMEIKNAYTNLYSSLRRTDALKKAVDAAERNYQLQSEDYERSLVSNLEVIQAVEDLQDIRREFILAKNEFKRRYWNFKVTTGENPHESF